MATNFPGSGPGAYTPQICYKCYAPLVIRKIKVKFPMAKVHAKCLQGHDQKFDIIMDQMPYWLPDVTNQLFRCDKCGAPSVQMSYPSSKEHYVRFYVPCLEHGDREKRIDGPLFPHIEAYFRDHVIGAGRRYGRGHESSHEHEHSSSRSKKSSSSTACPRCRRKLEWIGEYRRWYCYSCQQYV